MIHQIPKGSKIGIISPSTALGDIGEIRDGLKYLQDIGYQVILGKYVFDEYFNMAGSPEARAEDIMSFFQDPEIKAIICTRGGYGAQYILPLLDYQTIKQNPKPIIGFSDITTLQMGIFAQSGNISYSSIMLKYDFYQTAINPLTERSFKAVLDGKQPEIFSGLSVNKGKAKGTLLGTNLASLRKLIGTPYFPKLDNSILLLEDVDEKTYQFEYMLLQLQQNIDFAKVKGIIFGQFTKAPLNNSKDKDINEIIDQFAQKSKIPIIKNFAFGHIAARYTIPLGVEVEMDADNCLLKF